MLVYRNGLLRGICLKLSVCILLINVVFAGPNTAYALNGTGAAEAYIIKNGIMQGDGLGGYSMSSHVKRGDLAVMIVRAFHLGSYGGSNFSDVPAGSYYYDSIAVLKGMGIATGTGGLFYPDKYVLREEAIILIERAANKAKGNIWLNSGKTNIRGLYNTSYLVGFATREDVANFLYYILVMSDSALEDKKDPKNIFYTTKENKKLKFKYKDFTEALKNNIGGEFDFVFFPKPEVDKGKLYYNYSSETQYDSVVKKSTAYYLKENPTISRITFVPKKDFNGLVSIPYTISNRDGYYFSGYIKITVQDDDIISNIAYTVNKDGTIHLNKKDFIKKFKKVCDSDLMYVKFTLPSITFGKLYYQYKSTSHTDSTVLASTKYYMEHYPYIGDVFFVPDPTYKGKLPIYYTAYDKHDNGYTGTIELTVK